MRDGLSTESSVRFSAPTATGPQNEIWAFDKVEPILINYDKLRYRLMPYIYSLAGASQTTTTRSSGHW